MTYAFRRNAVCKEAAQHSVHPTGGSRRVFKHFAWLEVGSVKMVLSRPTHQRVTHTVGCFAMINTLKGENHDRSKDTHKFW